MTFRVMAYIMTVGGCVLGLRFIFAADAVLKEWGVEATAASLIVSRRLGVLYLGIALLFFLERSAGPSAMRGVFCLVTGGAIATLACLGFFDYRAHRVGTGVFRSVVAEAVLALGFVWAWWSGR